MTLAVVALEALAPALDLVWLLLTALCVVGGFLVFRWREQRVAPPRPEPADDVERLRSDTPAVVNMLANDATLTAAGLRATVIDLAARVAANPSTRRRRRTRSGTTRRPRQPR